MSNLWPFEDFKNPKMCTPTKSNWSMPHHPTPLKGPFEVQSFPNELPIQSLTIACPSSSSHNTHPKQKKCEAIDDIHHTHRDR